MKIVKSFSFSLLSRANFILCLGYKVSMQTWTLVMLQAAVADKRIENFKLLQVSYGSLSGQHSPNLVPIPSITRLCLLGMHHVDMRTRSSILRALAMPWLVFIQSHSLIRRPATHSILIPSRGCLLFHA